jgi:hypothetical protein
MSGTHIVPTPEDLQKLYRNKYGAVAKHGWRVRMRHRFGYIDADHYYEGFLDRLVTDGCSSTDTVGYRKMFGKQAAGCGTCETVQAFIGDRS